jgi:thiol-disulfide isomerase/thioredoxin
MSSGNDSVDSISILFYAKWCNPCKRIKPHYDSKVRSTYLMNGVTVYEYDYDSEHTKVLMNKFGVKTIPTLCFLNLSKTCSDPVDIKEEDITNIIRMDSQGIEKDWADPLSSFSTEEDF